MKKHMIHGRITYSEFPHHLTIIQRTNVIVTRRACLLTGVMEMQGKVGILPKE